MNPTVGVVVPAYRPDADRLADYAERVVRHVEPEAVRIELDDPLPGTVATLKRAPATVNAVSSRRGKGRAITDGFDALETDVYAFADADGSTPAASLSEVVAPVLEGSLALSVGSRRHPDAVVECHQTRVRRRLGDLFAWSARRLLPVALSDYQCGAKAITAEAWGNVRGRLREPGFGWDVDLVAAADAAGYRVGEVPVRWRDDPRSTVAPVGTPLELARTLLRVALRRRREGIDGVADPRGDDAGVDRRAAGDRRRSDHE
ncbi:glycosyltransferase [Saliphagus sp. LR7]|uniref:glycosyltransferase n=1 Tax=Saliphagus sp. LR7 TaxID=2282654 RepID=UPI000DF81AD6|nr:glycosyltransferase [Saliphagus sp. LR7]